MLTTSNLAICAIASKEPNRFTLSGIRVEPGCTVATDSHRLVRVTTPSKDVADASTYPVMPGLTPTDDFKPFILGTEYCKELIKNAPKKSTTPILKYIAVGKESDEACITDPATAPVSIGTTDLSVNRVLTPRRLSGNFPEYKRVIPDMTKYKAHVTLNAEYLRDAAVLAMGMNKDSRCPMITIHIKSANEAVVLTCKNTEQEMDHIIMPIRDEAATTMSTPSGGLFAMEQSIQAAIEANVAMLKTLLTLPEGESIYPAIHAQFQEVVGALKNLMAPPPDAEPSEPETSTRGREEDQPLETPAAEEEKEDA